VIVVDDDDDANVAHTRTRQKSTNYSPTLATALHTAALPSNPAAATSPAITASIMPQMIFTLQNGNALLMQPQPALLATGTGAYSQAMRLVSPVAVMANTQVCRCKSLLIITHTHTYVCLCIVHRTAPVYLAELCQPCTDPRRRSAARRDFEIPRTNRHFTTSSFSIAAPTAWNRLPTHIRTSTTLSSFLSRLKTHLYTISFAVH